MVVGEVIPVSDQPTSPGRVGGAPEIPQSISQTVTPTRFEQARKVVADVGDGVGVLAAPGGGFGRLILLSIFGQESDFDEREAEQARCRALHLGHGGSIYLHQRLQSMVIGNAFRRRSPAITPEFDRVRTHAAYSARFMRLGGGPLGIAKLLYGSDSIFDVVDLDEFRDRSRLLVEAAGPMFASGADADQIAAELLRLSGSPILVIKAVATATGMDIGDAKWIVHRNLDPEVRVATERLWADAIDALEEADRPPADGDRAR